MARKLACLIQEGKIKKMENFIVLNMFPNRGKEYSRGRRTVCISVPAIAYFFETEFSCEFENEKPFTYKRTIIKLIEGSMLDIEETVGEILSRIG